MENNPHFNKIFWFIVGLSGFVLLYTLLITFCHIPKENIRFADTSQGFLLGSALSAGIAYLIGGTPFFQSAKKTSGTKTETLSLTATTETPNNEPSTDTAVK